MKYKLEKWKLKVWKDTKRQDTINVDRLVKRDLKGRFISVLTNIREKTYGSGIYKIGLKNGKVVTRKKIAQKTPEWYERKKEVIKGRTIFRCSLVLNDIPSTRLTGRNEYYGFRIIAFSHSKTLLKRIYPEKMRQRLIEYIEDCFRYKETDFWFSTNKSFFGHEDITITNTVKSDDGTYYLQWQKRYGQVIKREQNSIGDLL
jgi:hypothetical protein